MSTKKNEPGRHQEFPLSKEKYKLLAIGFAIIIIGFILMIGGRSDNPDVFNMDMFSIRRTIISPILVMFGFMFEIWVIMKKSKED